MNTHKTIRNLAAVSLLAFGAALGAAACSSDNSSGPGPTQKDASGTDSTAGGDSGTTGDSSSTTDSSVADTGTGNCTSDASTCNSCATPAQDPLNACSSYTANCVPFDKGRVPSHPTL